MSAGDPAPVPEGLVSPGRVLDAAEADRYSRHLSLPEIAATGQRRLKNARVLVIGAGGLGSPILLYLAAAGVGTIGVVDDDRVELSNLQRQVIHGVDDIGRLKVDSARDALAAVNPLVHVQTHPVRLSAENAVTLFEDYDVIVDGADNFATRYLASDAAEITAKPCVWGSILRFSAQVSVFWSTHGVTYRDLYPDSPAPEDAPSCGEAGVLGMLCGVTGSLMAAEVVKLVTGAGRPLLGRVCIFDLKDATWRELALTPDPQRQRVTHLESADESCAPPTTVGQEATVTVDELRESLSERAAGRVSFELVDVREEGEFQQFHIPGSLSMPLSRLRDDSFAHPEMLRDRSLVICCKAGPRAEAAARILREAGHRDLRLLLGGVDRWLLTPRDDDGALSHAEATLGG